MSSKNRFSPLVHIIIVNYKNWHESMCCIDSILGSNYNSYKIYLIDNHSCNHSIENLMRWMRQAHPETLSFQVDSENVGDIISNKLRSVCFIQHDRNDGFAAGNNIVLRHLCNTDDYVWLLNPDMVVEKATLSQLADFANGCTIKTIIGTSIYSFADKEKLLFYGGGRINYNSSAVSMNKNKFRLHKLDYISGGSLFVHASAFNTNGLLPENYFLYWEDSDWCYKAKKNEYSLAVCTDAICYDKVSTTIGKGFMGDYYYTRNGLLFIAQVRPGKIPIIIFFNCLRFLKRIIMGRWNRAGGVYKGTIDFIKKRKHENQ